MDTAYGLATHWKLRTGQVCVSVCVGWFEICFTEGVGRRQEAQQEVGIFCEYVRGNFLSISGFGACDGLLMWCIYCRCNSGVSSNQAIFLFFYDDIPTYGLFAPTLTPTADPTPTPATGCSPWKRSSFHVFHRANKALKCCCLFSGDPLISPHFKEPLNYDFDYLSTVPTRAGQCDVMWQFYTQRYSAYII